MEHILKLHRLPKILSIALYSCVCVCVCVCVRARADNACVALTFLPTSFCYHSYNLYSPCISKIYLQLKPCVYEHEESVL